MNKIFVIILTAAAAVIISACGSTQQPVENSAADPNKYERKDSAPKLPGKDDLFALEKNAWEAWKNKDEAYFKEAMTDKFIGFGPRGPLDKAAAIKNIIDPKCEVKSYSFSDEQLNFAGRDAAILTYKGTQDVTCGGKPQPQQVWSASVYVRDGEKWKNAYYNEVAVFNPERPPEQLPPAPKTKAGEQPKADELTEALLDVQNRSWEAWKNHDANAMREAMANNFIYVDQSGKQRYNHDEALKSVSESPCDVKGFEFSDVKGTKLSDEAAILTYKGSAEGTCNGRDLSSIWGTTIFMKEGDRWRALLVYENRV